MFAIYLPIAEYKLHKNRTLHVLFTQYLEAVSKRRVENQNICWINKIVHNW